MGALERPVGHRGREGRPHLGKEVLALRLEALERRQLVMIGPGGVEGNEVKVGKVVAHRIEVLGVSIPRHKLAERDALMAANVLNAKLAALLPDRIRQLLVVKPPATL